MSAAPCPVCEAEVPRRAGGSGSSAYEMLTCSGCGLRFSHPMEEPGSSYYDASPLYGNRREGTPVGDPQGDWRYRTFFRHVPLQDGTSLLDIGCGDGGFMAQARRRGARAFGIDLDPRAVELAREVHQLEHVVAGPWQRLDELHEWGPFGAVTLFDVVEHVAAPLDLVALAGRRLRPGGTLCLTVPRLDRFPRIFDPVADAPPHHLTLWTSKAVEELLERAGFADVRIMEKPLLPEDLRLHAVWRARRATGRLGRERKPGPAPGRPGLVRTLLLGFVELASMLTVGAFRLCRLDRGHTLLALAVKPGATPDASGPVD